MRTAGLFFVPSLCPPLLPDFPYLCCRKNQFNTSHKQ
nr:MAG TPA_asm: hypothetical protein [Caudoviricetes sp.]